jgi:hypothetical protein
MDFTVDGSPDANCVSEVKMTGKEMQGKLQPSGDPIQPGFLKIKISPSVIPRFVKSVSIKKYLAFTPVIDTVQAKSFIVYIEIG